MLWTYVKYISQVFTSALCLLSAQQLSTKMAADQLILTSTAATATLSQTEQCRGRRYILPVCRKRVCLLSKWTELIGDWPSDHLPHQLWSKLNQFQRGQGQYAAGIISKTVTHCPTYNWYCISFGSTNVHTWILCWFLCRYNKTNGLDNSSQKAQQMTTTKSTYCTIIYKYKILPHMTNNHKLPVKWLQHHS